VFTEESSQEQVTPIREEHAEPPAPLAGNELQQPPVKPALYGAWIDVAKAMGVWIVSVFMLLIVPTIFSLPYLIYRIAKAGPPTPQALATDKGLIFYSVLGILPAHLLTLTVIWMVVTEGGRRPFWKTIGFEWPENLGPAMSTILSVLLAILLFGLALAITMLYGQRKTDLDIMIESSIYTRIATAFAAVATAPLVEELIYRGVLYRALEKAAGMQVALPIVSLLFAGVHVFQYRNNLAVIAVITLLSMTLTTVRAATGKVLPAFIIHLVFNGIQSVLIVLGGFIDKDIFK
jgi:membrane protease YdiL (CAAX protease family)